MKTSVYGNNHKASIKNPWEDEEGLENLLGSLWRDSDKGLTFDYADIDAVGYFSELEGLNKALKTQTQFQRIYADFLGDVEMGKITLDEAREKMDALARGGGFVDARRFYDYENGQIRKVFNGLDGKKIIFGNALVEDGADKVFGGGSNTLRRKRINNVWKTQTQFQRIYADFLGDVEKGEITLDEAKEKMDFLAMQRGFDGSDHFYTAAKEKINELINPSDEDVMGRSAEENGVYTPLPKKVIKKEKNTKVFFRGKESELERKTGEDGYPFYFEDKSPISGQSKGNKEIDNLNEGLGGDYGKSQNKPKRKGWKRLFGIGSLATSFVFIGTYLFNTHSHSAFERPVYEANARELEREILSPPKPTTPLISSNAPPTQRSIRDYIPTNYRAPRIVGEGIWELDMDMEPVSAEDKEIEGILLESYVKAVSNQNFLRDSMESGGIKQTELDSLSYFNPLTGDSLRTDTLKQASLGRKIGTNINYKINVM